MAMDHRRMIFAGLSEFIVGDLTDWVKDVIDSIGYVGVAGLVALENVFPPIPSEIVLPAAGLWAKDNGGVGALIAMIVYGVARWIGPERLRGFVDRYGRWFGVKVKDIDKAEAWFDARDELAVLLCRCVPLVRSFVSIPAGFSEMNPLKFTLYTAAGSAVWNTALIVVGYAAQQHIDKVETIISYAQYVVVLAIVGAVAWFIWRRKIRPQEPELADAE
jgi:membrane protein DedA with SNARE-associated domain